MFCLELYTLLSFGGFEGLQLWRNKNFPKLKLHDLDEGKIRSSIVVSELLWKNSVWL